MYDTKKMNTRKITTKALKCWWCQQEYQTKIDGPLDLLKKFVNSFVGVLSNLQ